MNLTLTQQHRIVIIERIISTLEQQILDAKKVRTDYPECPDLFHDYSQYRQSRVDVINFLQSHTDYKLLIEMRLSTPSTPTNE